MQKQANLQFKDDTFFVSGELDFSNVDLLYAKSLSKLLACPRLAFDFSGVTSSNSAGLALVIEWIKFAKANQKPIHFHSLSSDLMSIAKVAAIDNIINGIADLN